MKNLIFSHNNEKYITTFGTGYHKSTEKISQLPTEMFPLLMDDITAPTYIDVTSITEVGSEVIVQGTVILNSIMYNVNTKHPDLIYPIKAKEIPTDVLGEIEAITKLVPTKELLIEEGDVFCIENNWTKSGNFYYIDSLILGVRYYHSDTQNIVLESIVLEDVRRNL